MATTRKPYTKQAPAPAVAATAASISFRLINVDKVPKYTPGNPQRKYKEVEEALRVAPKGQALAIPIPAEYTGAHAKFASNVLSSVRRVLPGTRSRTTPDVLYLWLGEVAHRAKKAVAGAREGAAA